MYAVWEEITYNVNFIITSTRSELQNNKLYSVEYTMPSVDYTGYNLQGWKIEKIVDKNGKPVSSELIGTIITTGVYSRLSYVADSVVTLKAIYDYNYYIRFNNNKPSDLDPSEISGRMSDIFVKNNAITKLASNSYAAKYYKFIGWSTKKADTVPMFANGAYVQNLAEYDGQIVTLYAIWKATQYRITFKNNGLGKTFDNKTEVTAVFDVDKPYRMYAYFDYSGNKYLYGYTFEKKATDDSKYFEIGGSYTNIISRGSVELYAQWKKASSGGGGGGGGGGGSTVTNNIEITNGNYVTAQMSEAAIAGGKVHTNITHGTWVYDSNINKWRYSSGQNSSAVTLFSDYSSLSYINDGFYKLGNEGYMYYFDPNGYMVTGFIEYANHIYYAEEAGQNVGALICGTRVIDGIEYTFNNFGEMLKPADGIWTVVEGFWYLNPFTNTWNFVVYKNAGGIDLVKEGTYKIKDMNGIYRIYTFDAYGNMIQQHS